ncbi:unnamed protein product [Heligmosomoides polygyrus]|uniref:G_PROTEIN_RECEP_F1_2 domain-containing protein n=1 Tax=Heligmosomoides polygyrus TaxID=6339 RepID=A0A183FDY9_HELPZ|nr:unnamed protein product [Heligmosomoides polygyrus]
MWNSSEIDEAYANMTHVSAPSPGLAIIFGCVTLIGIVGNLALLLYILIHKLYQNFISSHFIAHLCITNLVALMILLPIFLYTLWTGVNVFQDSNFMCRLQVSSSFWCSSHSFWPFDQLNNQTSSLAPLVLLNEELLERG